jgi:hypothetical protein
LSSAFHYRWNACGIFMNTEGSRAGACCRRHRHRNRRPTCPSGATSCGRRSALAQESWPLTLGANRVQLHPTPNNPNKRYLRTGSLGILQRPSELRTRATHVQKGGRSSAQGSVASGRLRRRGVVQDKVFECFRVSVWATRTVAQANPAFVRCRG